MKKPPPTKIVRFIRDMEKQGKPYIGRRVGNFASRMYVCCNIYIDTSVSPWYLYDGTVPSVR